MKKRKSVTQENIRRKRIARRKQRIKAFFRLILFTIVASVVVGALGWLSVIAYDWANVFYAEQKQIYDGYLQRKEQRQAGYDTRFDRYTNILLVGLDEGMEEGGPQADSIQLLSLDEETGKMRFVIIPRYTIANIPGSPAPEVINNAYYYGGVKLVQQSVADLLGVTIHHYAVIDPKILTDVVNLLGGVDIYVENEMNYEDPDGGLYIHIPKGYQKMDGDTAQKYLRYKSDELGSVGRLHRQQLFLKALYSKVTSSESVTKLPQLIDIFQSRMTTTAELYDTADLINAIKHLDVNEPVVCILPGNLPMDGSGTWIYDREKTKLKMNELFPAPVVEEKKEEGGWFNW